MVKILGYFIAFSTSFSHGIEVDTGNTTHPNPFPKIATLIKSRHPKVKDAYRLYEIHKTISSRHGVMVAKSSPRRAMKFRLSPDQP